MGLYKEFSWFEHFQQWKVKDIPYIYYRHQIDLNLRLVFIKNFPSQRKSVALSSAQTLQTMETNSLTTFSIEIRKLIYFSPHPIKIQLQVLSQDRIKLIWQIVTSQSMQQICRELGEHQKATNNRQLTLVYLPNSTQKFPPSLPCPSVCQSSEKGIRAPMEFSL